MRLLLYAASAIFFCAGAQAETITSSQNASLLDGANSYGGLVADSNGNLFGTTSYGGTGGRGSIFRIGADGSGFTTLHGFSGNDGDRPTAGLIVDGSGNLFGTTALGGANGQGSIFRIGSDGSGFSTLFSFSFVNFGPGIFPRAGLVIDGNGNLFGTASLGGSKFHGSVFRISSDGSGFTELHGFGGLRNGSQPWGGLTFDNNGNLFGTTFFGGFREGGTVFRIGTDGSGFSTLHRFTGAVIPEPGTWAMMIMGFGLVGASLRMRRASSGEGHSEQPGIA